MNYGFVDIYRDIPADAVLEANSATKGKGKIPLDRLTALLGFNIKGTATVEELSAMTGMQAGDTWAVSDSGTLPSGLALTAGDLVRWDGSEWKLILHIDLSAYATKEELGEEASAREAADEELAGYISEHLQDKDNPHEVTAGQVGAYTKSETDEAIAGALSGKKDTQADIDTDTSSGSGKGGTTRTLTRLQQNANGVITPTFADIPTASAQTKGLMGTAEYTKLSGIAEGATKTEASSTNGNIKIDGADTNVYTHPAQTAYTGKPTADATPAFGETFTVSQVTTNETGHVTELTDRMITIPNATATTSVAGLMSAADKTKLNGIAEGAEVNQNAFGNVKVGSATITAASKTDTLEIADGTGIDAVGDTDNNKVTLSLNSATQASLEKADTALQSESDPVFSASAAAGISSSDITNWNSKQPGRLVVINNDNTAFSKISAAIAAGKDVWLNTNATYSDATYSHYVPLTEAVFHSGSYDSFIFARSRAYSDENGIVDRWTCNSSGWKYESESVAYAVTAGTAGEAGTANSASNANLGKTTDTTNGDLLYIGGGTQQRIDNAGHANSAKDYDQTGDIATALAGRVLGKTIPLASGYALSVTIPWATRTGRSSMLVIVSGNNGVQSCVQVSWFKDANNAIRDTKMNVLSYTNTGAGCVPMFYVQYGTQTLGACGIYLVLDNSSWATQVTVIPSMENVDSVAFDTVAKSTAQTATDLSSERVWSLQGAWDGTPTPGSTNAVTSNGIATALAGKQDTLSSSDSGKVVAVGSTGSIIASLADVNDVNNIANYNRVHVEAIRGAVTTPLPPTYMNVGLYRYDSNTAVMVPEQTGELNPGELVGTPIEILQFTNQNWNPMQLNCEDFVIIKNGYTSDLTDIWQLGKIVSNPKCRRFRVRFANGDAYDWYINFCHTYDAGAYSGSISLITNKLGRYQTYYQVKVRPKKCVKIDIVLSTVGYNLNGGIIAIIDSDEPDEIT